MTIRELIQELRRYPEATEVMFQLPAPDDVTQHGDFIFNQAQNNLVLVVDPEAN